MSTPPTQVGEVVIVGSRELGNEQYVYMGYDSFSSRLVTGGWWGGGGGHGTSYDGGPESWLDHDLVWDAATDEMAKFLASRIVNDPMYTKVEIAFIMVRDGFGQVRATGPFYGVEGSDPQAKISMAGIHPANVVGIIHSHPAELQSAGWDMTPWPSYNGPGIPSDWNAADTLLNALVYEYQKEEFKDFFSNYIVGPDGQLREFDFDNRTHDPTEVLSF